MIIVKITVEIQSSIVLLYINVSCIITIDFFHKYSLRISYIFIVIIALHFPLHLETSLLVIFILIK